MRAIVTGANGTVGRALSARLARAGATVIPWDRGRVPTDRYDAMERFVREARADVIFHLAVASQSTGRDNEGWHVTYEWSSELAWIARVLSIRFVFTSTAMVFSSRTPGPFTSASRPDEAEGYGCQKRLAEERVLDQNPGAAVVRLGWQIGPPTERDENQMTAQLGRRMRDAGEIRASTLFFPACSFLEDTAEALVQVAREGRGGVRMVDQNEGFSLYAIAGALSRLHDAGWNVVAADDFAQDQRMHDDDLTLPPLSSRLPTLGAITATVRSPRGTGREPRSDA
jgi:dTDP-4-dehydrorhamnose reductase